MNVRRTIQGTCLLLIASLFAACSSVPTANTALDQARDRYQAAQGDSQITSLAAEELKQAGRSLSKATQAWENQEPDGTVDHLAYMALQHVVVAEENAAGRAAQAVTANAAAETHASCIAHRRGRPGPGGT